MALIMISLQIQGGGGSGGLVCSGDADHQHSQPQVGPQRQQVPWLELYIAT